ncbi:hypothetical protein RGP44_001940 [Serratia marcescens]|uniref:hypothetical protein n=1 Tax=Serratia TaxID=613 RepID=UPI00187FE4DB|nr:hypothetical protein [Serratia marcescens]ELN4406653.1 hypothetical protein [Serratia marcescens]MBN5297054.1 hypothetical protein [Serratia marcescens]QOV56017.1 hypothetical protein CA266_11610 [Serratia marcescens]CAI1551494.1 Uncharacterised protein [Serratia marcescens]HBC5197754.1 hypothetical protein [Serratia marcescens]
MTRRLSFIEINKEQFDMFFYGRSPYMKTFSNEISWFKFEKDGITLLATIVLCNIDKDFNAIILGRDLNKKFRAINVIASFTSKEDLIVEVNSCIPKMLSQHHNGLFMQGDESPETFSLFMRKVPEEKRNIYMKMLLEDPKHYPAYIVLEELAYWFKDPDGIFIRDFQSASFNSRLFELYLNAVFYELDFTMNRNHNQPDFMLSKFNIEIAVEAASIAEIEDPLEKKIVNQKQYEEIDFHVKNVMPFKFARTLLKKVNHRPEPNKLYYWELEHTKNKPFIIAMQDYSKRMSMGFSNVALHSYLYGVDMETGNKIEVHSYESRSIKSNFFSSPKNKHVSAVFLTTQATLPKFNRMGVLAGIEQKDCKTIVNGTRTDDDFNIVPFVADISDSKYEEPWCTAAYMYHNPNAHNPVDYRLFPNVVHVFQKDDGFEELVPKNYILQSTTVVLSTH